MKTGNLFASVPTGLKEEFFEVLAEGDGELKVERIVSSQQLLPADKWYEQATTEWVAVLKGSAVLGFETESLGHVYLEVGDWIEIPPMVRHRVERVSKNEETVWLAIHWLSNDAKAQPE
ncbi:MAG: cupin [Verrucomicrobiota bacterium]